jgi:hypothetical protein
MRLLLLFLFLLWIAWLLQGGCVVVATPASQEEKPFQFVTTDTAQIEQPQLPASLPAVPPLDYAYSSGLTTEDITKIPRLPPNVLRYPMPTAKEPDKRMTKDMVQPTGHVYGTPEDARHEASAVHKGVLLVFTGPSCPFCRVFENNVLPKPVVKDYLKDNLVVAIVDCDQHPDIAEAYHITRIPKAFVLTSNLENPKPIFPVPQTQEQFLSVLKSL